MNRILSAVIFFTALSGLTACSSDNDNNDGGTPSATGSPTTGGSGTAGDGSAGSGSGSTTSGSGTQPTDSGGANGPDGTGTGGAGTGGTNTGSSGGGGTSAGGSDGSGNGGGGGGSSTSVSAQNISNAPASNAEIATDANGNALAVWQQHDGTRNNVYYSRFTGGSWSAPALLENLDGDTTKPDVAMNSAGNAIAVWTQPNGSYSRWTWARHFAPATGWGAPVIVGTYTDNGPPNRDNANAAIDDSGTAIALWEEVSVRTCGGASLVASVFRVGSGWSDDRVLHCGWSQRADIAMDGNGNAIVGYMHDGGGDGEAAHAVHYTNGAWSAPVILTPLPPTRSIDGGIRVAMNAAGEALAVWSHEEILPDNLVHSLSVSRYRGGVWTREQWEWGYAPSVAMASNGNITVTWHQDDGGIYARRLEAGAWLSPVRVGVGTNARAVAPGAGPVMVWMQGDDLMFSHYLGGNVWQSPQTAESNAEPVNAPRLAASTYANAFVAWLQPSGVWARRLP